MNIKLHYLVHKSSPLVPILSQINPVYIPPFYSRSHVILLSHLCLGNPSDLFLSSFAKILCAFLCHACYMSRPFHSPLFVIPMIYNEEQQLWRLSLYSFSFLNPVLKHPQFILPPQCQRQSFAPRQNCRRRRYLVASGRAVKLAGERFVWCGCSGWMADSLGDQPIGECKRQEENPISKTHEAADSRCLLASWNEHPHKLGVVGNRVVSEIWTWGGGSNRRVVNIA
jgi:hypothetical protein